MTLYRLTILPKLAFNYDAPFKGPVREQPHARPLNRGHFFWKVYFVWAFLSEYRTPLFLDPVFYQELEKTGFSFVWGRESVWIHSFSCIASLKLDISEQENNKIVH